MSPKRIDLCDAVSVRAESVSLARIYRGLFDPGQTVAVKRYARIGADRKLASGRGSSPCKCDDEVGVFAAAFKITRGRTLQHRARRDAYGRHRAPTAIAALQAAAQEDIESLLKFARD